MTLSWMQGLDDGRILYTTYLEAMIQAFGRKYVYSGMECSADGTSLTVTISAGVVRYYDTDYIYDGGSVTLDAGESDRDRADVIVWDFNDGNPTITVLKGSRWLNVGGEYKPLTERINDSQIPLAVAIVRQGESVITPADLYDMRLNRGDVEVTEAGFRNRINVAEGAMFQVPDDVQYIAYEEVYVSGELYVEGELVIY